MSEKNICGCRKLCFQVVDKSARETLQNHLSQLPYLEKNRYLSDLLKFKECQKRRPNPMGVKKAREFSTIYSIPSASGKINVCRKAFANILGIGNEKIRELIRKITEGDLEDNRGKHRSSFRMKKEKTSKSSAGPLDNWLGLNKQADIIRDEHRNNEDGERYSTKTTLSCSDSDEGPSLQIRVKPMSMLLEANQFQWNFKEQSEKSTCRGKINNGFSSKLELENENTAVLKEFSMKPEPAAFLNVDEERRKKSKKKNRKPDKQPVKESTSQANQLPKKTQRCFDDVDDGLRIDTCVTQPDGKKTKKKSREELTDATEGVTECNLEQPPKKRKEWRQGLDFEIEEPYVDGDSAAVVKKQTPILDKLCNSSNSEAEPESTVEQTPKKRKKKHKERSNETKAAIEFVENSDSHELVPKKRKKKHKVEDNVAFAVSDEARNDVELKVEANLEQVFGPVEQAAIPIENGQALKKRKKKRKEKERADSDEMTNQQLLTEPNLEQVSKKKKKTYEAFSSESLQLAENSYFPMEDEQRPKKRKKKHNRKEKADSNEMTNLQVTEPHLEQVRSKKKKKKHEDASDALQPVENRDVSIAYEEPSKKRKKHKDTDITGSAEEGFSYLPKPKKRKDMTGDEERKDPDSELESNSEQQPMRRKKRRDGLESDAKKQEVDDNDNTSVWSINEQPPKKRKKNVAWVDEGAKDSLTEKDNKKVKKKRKKTVEDEEEEEDAMTNDIQMTVDDF